MSGVTFWDCIAVMALTVPWLPSPRRNRDGLPNFAASVAAGELPEEPPDELPDELLEDVLDEPPEELLDAELPDEPPEELEPLEEPELPEELELPDELALLAEPELLLEELELLDTEVGLTVVEDPPEPPHAARVRRIAAGSSAGSHEFLRIWVTGTFYPMWCGAPNVAPGRRQTQICSAGRGPSGAPPRAV